MQRKRDSSSSQSLPVLKVSHSAVIVSWLAAKAMHSRLVLHSARRVQHALCNLNRFHNKHKWSRTSRESASAGILLLGSLTTIAPVVQCRDNDDETEQISQLMEVVGAGGFGGTTGFCAGFAFRKAGKLAVFSAGSVMSLFQLAAYNGYITIDWEMVKRDVTKLFDADGDGEIDSNDMQHWLDWTIVVLTHNTGGTSVGFAAGFLAGFTRG